MTEITGRDVVAGLAETYYQLYVKPGGEESERQYKDIVTRGGEPEERSLSHFILDERDRLTVEETPAGEISVITLYNRKDYETFIKIMASKCRDVPIPPTQGASFLNGVINWRKIEAHEEEFIKEELLKGNEDPDWDSEFKRFTSVKENFKDALIVLSIGPYSGVDVSRAVSVIDRIGGGPESVFYGSGSINDRGKPSAERWLSLSDTIRRVHECTHFICRKLYPDKIDEVWDELVADSAGVYAAFGSYIPEMVELFLGIGPGPDGAPGQDEAYAPDGDSAQDRISGPDGDSGDKAEEHAYVYTGGRLENYVKGDETVISLGPVKAEFEPAASMNERLDILAGRVHTVLEGFRETARENEGIGAFEFAVRLEELHG